VLAARGGTPFAKPSAHHIDAQLEQDKVEAIRLQSFHQKQHAVAAAAFPSAARAAGLRSTAIKLLERRSISCSHFQGGMGLIVTYPDAQTLQALQWETVVAQHEVAPSLTLSLARRVLVGITWPELPMPMEVIHQSSLSANSSSTGFGVRRIAVKLKGALVLSDFLVWLRGVLQNHAPPNSATAALGQPVGAELGLTSLQARFLAFVPGALQAKEVCVEASHGRGIHLQAAPLSPGGTGQGTAYAIAFTRSAWTQSKLLHALEKFYPVPPTPSPLLAHSDLSKAQGLALVRDRREDPLPEGIVFDGRAYRDALGRVLLQHPSHRTFQQDFLNWANVRVQAANAQLLELAGHSDTYWEIQALIRPDINQLLSEYLKRDT
jgi:hypothetical protein